MLKLKKAIGIILVSIEFMILFFCYISHYNPIMPLYQFLYRDLDKLKVHFQATTGPRNYVEEDINELKKLEMNQFPDLDNLSSSEIELVGNTSFSFEEDYLTGDKITLVYGKLIGVSKLWEEDEDVPIFKVYYFKPINYKINGLAPSIILMYQFFIFYIIINNCILLIKRRKIMIEKKDLH